MIGFLGFIACIILLIIALVKKRAKKPFLIGLAASLVVTFTGGALVPAPQETPPETKAVASTTASEAEAKPTKKATPEKESEAEKQAAEKDAKENAAKAKAAKEKAAKEKAAKEKAAKEKAAKEKAAKEKAAKERAEKEKAAKEKAAKKEDKEKKAEKKKAAVQTKSKPETPSAPLSQAVSLIDTSMKKNYGENYGIDYDETTVTVNIWPEGVGNEAYVASTGDVDTINAWSKRVYALKDKSSSLVKQLAESGYPGMTVVINVLNDQRLENSLLSVKNGEVTYNWVDSDEAQANNLKNITVYITDTGEKYHTDGCRTLHESQYSVSLEEAKQRGYEPCGVCNPPVR